MIRFMCPACSVTLESPDRKAGNKVICPNCGQKLRVPTPCTRNKTILGKLLPSSSSDASNTDESMPEKEAESKQGRGSRKRSGNKGCYFLLILALIGLLAIVAVLFVGIICLMPKFAGNTLTPSLTSPTEDDEGVKWSHKELIGYLQKQGVVVLAESTSYRASDGPAMFFFERTDPLDAYLKAVANGADRLYDGATVCTHFAHVSKVKSTQEAKDEAGVKADRAFSWGRFVFRGDPEYLARIKRVLP